MQTNRITIANNPVGGLRLSEDNEEDDDERIKERISIA